MQAALVTIIHHCQICSAVQHTISLILTFSLQTTLSLSLHPLCGGGDLLFLLSPPAAASTCFCSHSKTPTRIISKYLQYAYWPWGIWLVIFFFCIFQFLKQNPNGRQILWHTLEFEPLHRFVSCLF